MFQLSRNAEYALMTLKLLADAPKDQLVSAREISEKLKIPYDNVAKSLQKFTKISLLESVQGVHGGYHLKGDLSKTTLFQILEAVDGPVGLVRCQGEGHSSCDHVYNCNIINPADRLNFLLTKILKSQSLAEFFGLIPPDSQEPDDFAVWR